MTVSIMALSVEDLIQQINATDQTSFSSDADARIRLILAAQALVARLETPWEFIQRIWLQEVCSLAFESPASASYDIDLQLGHKARLPSFPA